MHPSRHLSSLFQLVMIVDQGERLDYVVNNYIEVFQKMSAQSIDVYGSVFRQFRPCIIQDFRTVLSEFLADLIHHFETEAPHITRNQTFRLNTDRMSRIYQLRQDILELYTQLEIVVNSFPTPREVQRLLANDHIILLEETHVNDIISICFLFFVYKLLRELFFFI